MLDFLSLQKSHKAYHFPSNLSEFHTLVPYDSSHFIWAFLSVIAAPLIWNILARICRIITKNKDKRFQYITCYILAIYIFSFSTYRDYLVHNCISNSPILSELSSKNPYFLFIQFISIIIGLTGQIFVLTSLWQLGITGTFLGDYCGILMNSRVTGFPFNVLNNPMYIGSSLSFLASSLYQGSLVGIILTIEIYIVYTIALLFEEPYTAKIYAEREAKRKNKTK